MSSEVTPYQERMAAAQSLIVEHNAALEDSPLDWTVIQSKLRQMGATSLQSLRHLTYEDLQEAGIPRILARRIANEVFRPQPTKQPEQPAYRRVITEARAAAMAIEELLSHYDPSGELNPAVTRRLRELVQDRPCIVFNPAGQVLLGPSRELVRELMQGEPPRQFLTTDYGISKVYALGQLPDQVLDENPLRPGTALRADQTDPETGRSWVQIPFRIRQLAYLAVNTGEISITGPISIHDVLDRLVAASEMTSDQLQQRWPRAALMLRELEVSGKSPSLKLTRQLTKQAGGPAKDNPFNLGKHHQY